MIRVAVTLHGSLRRLQPAGAPAQRLELPDGSRVADAIAQLHGTHEIWVAAIGEVVVPLATPLADGMAVDFFPHPEGG